MPDFLKHFPYPKPREIQIQLLTALSEAWDKYDVFVLVCPTAFGKTAIARTLQRSLHSVSVITPTNLLVQQFLDEFPDTPTLSRLDSYHCAEWDRPCSVTRGKLRGFCSKRTGCGPCPAATDLARAKYRRGPGIYNYHTYLAHQLHRQVLVVDEAHNLLSTIADRMALKLWRHDYHYPPKKWDYQLIADWAQQEQLRRRRKDRKLDLLRQAAAFPKPSHVIEWTTESFSGKGTIRGEPEERDLIRLLPVDIRNAPPMFWPAGVEKIVLMSATIGNRDIESLGLAGRRVCYIDCKSPIPAEQRPVFPLDLVPVTRANLESSTREIARYIEEQLLPQHVNEKGIIHATYQQAALLRNYLSSNRFIFHDRFNKSEQYDRFCSASPQSGAVLVASGMYEGIDLPGDLGKWQVIGKVPWQSLGNPAIRHKSESEPGWYEWETLRTVIQACGRICRTPEDRGVTYIVDSTFSRLFATTESIRPEWFTDAIDGSLVTSRTN